MSAIMVRIAAVLLGVSHALVYSGDPEVPAGAKIHDARLITLPGADSPLKVTVYQDAEGSAADIVVERDGRQMARATQNCIGLEAATGVYDVTGDGVPEVVLAAVEGAKALTGTIYALPGLEIIGHWDGFSIKVVQIAKRPVVAVLPDQYGALTDLYVWDNDKKTFKRCNASFPEFYGSEIEAQRKTLDSSGMPAYVFAQACQLGATALVYGGKYAEAEVLCEKAKKVVNTPARLIPSEIGGSGEALQRDQTGAVERINKVLQAVGEAKQDGKTELNIK